LANGNGLTATGLSHLVVPVDDLAVAEFYRDTLGFGPGPADSVAECGRSVTLQGAEGGLLVLYEDKDRPDLKATGVHQAYGVSASARGRILDALAAQGIEVHGYKEDNPEEEADNCYFFDAAGNRVQLVTRNTESEHPALDHAAIQVANMWWAETFYQKALGCAVTHRCGWKTDDYTRAQLWADGVEDMAPGTRRMDKRYSSMVNKKEMPRVNLQIYLRIGQAPFALYLANRHFQESPEEARIGTPRTAFAVTAATLNEACRRLDAAQWKYEGPVNHKDGPLARALYFRDPGGNFIELCERRDN
jgi:catechol-2,3-dioxygenase